MGRKKTEKWGPRLIDIDILFYESDIVNKNELMIPHRHLHERTFVLIPLQDILPHFIHPQINKTITELCNDLENDTSLFIKTVKNE